MTKLCRVSLAQVHDEASKRRRRFYTQVGDARRQALRRDVVHRVDALLVTYIVDGARAQNQSELKRCVASVRDPPVLYVTGECT